MNARLVLLVLVVLFVSGLGELGPRTSRGSSPLACSAARTGSRPARRRALVAMHVYLAVLHPATRPAFRGITLGSVDREWAEHHHGAWVAESTHGRRGSELPAPPGTRSGTNGSPMHVPQAPSR